MRLQWPTAARYIHNFNGIWRIPLNSTLESFCSTYFLNFDEFSSQWRRKLQNFKFKVSERTEST